MIYELQDYKEYHTDSSVYFSVTLSEENMRIAEQEGLEKRFKLINSIATSNMVCFDAEGRIKKYTSPESILQEFYHLRLQFYQRRKEYLADQLTQEWEKLNNKVRFITEIISGKFVVQNRKKADILKDLAARGYKPFSKNGKDNSSNEEDGSENDEEAGEVVKSNDYDYLLSMQLWSLTSEKVERLRLERDEKQCELDDLLGTTVKEMWYRDLDAFEQEWAAFEAEITANESKSANMARKAKAGKLGGKKAKKVAKKKNFDSDEEESSDLIDDDDDDDFVVKPAKSKHRLFLLIFFLFHERLLKKRQNHR